MNNTDIKVLVLDDDIAVQESLEAFLEDENFFVLKAGSAEQALEILEDSRVDIAIVDIRLPGKNGDEFIAEMLKRGTDTKFIIYTGSVGYSHPKAICNSGNVYKKVFIKPQVNLNIFVSVIEQIMSLEKE